VNELSQFLLEHLIIDFDGEVDIDNLRSCLRKDASPQARALLEKIVAEGGVEEFMITLADCLMTNISTGITPQVVKDHMVNYSEA